MTKRLLALCLTLTLLLTVLPLAVHAEYDNTHVNTGNQRYDIIQVALTQVGYQEGSRSYTKYGDYFGWPNTDWCGWFVSWCAAQADVPRSVLKRQGIASASNFGLSTFKASERLPQSGDLYFKSGHVGLVYKVEGDYFWSVEGNSSDQVEIEKLSLFSSRYWFASPNYGGSNNAAHTHSMQTGYDSGHPHKEYKKCSSCDYITYTGNTRSVADCAACIQENCTHQYSSWTSSGSSSHEKNCSLCGKTLSDDHDWEFVKTLSEPTCGTSGSERQRCTTCGAERNNTIAKTNNHSYNDWVKAGEEQHSRTCEICGKTVTADHKPDGTLETPWETTEDEHWQSCTICGEQFLLGTHEFGENCVSPCEICEYVRPEGHLFGQNYLTDENNHWQACEACGEQTGEEPHVYSAACDEDCDICGYTREVTHTFPETMDTDAAAHYYECDVCGKIEGRQNHIPGPDATEEAAQNCTVCGYELAARIVHVHDYAPYQQDSLTHWGTCRCGLQLQPEAHSWDMSTGKCAACGITATVETEARNWDFVWLILCGAVVCTIAVTTGVLVHSYKKRKALQDHPYWA